MRNKGDFLVPHCKMSYNIHKDKSKSTARGSGPAERVHMAEKGLVLAGGGARGSYQVGVYKALEELGWRPQVITGTSVGCLNGALFVQNSWESARDMWLSIDDHEVMRLPQSDSPSQIAEFLAETVKNGGLDVSPLERLVDRMLDEDAIRHAPIRFGLVTVNLTDHCPEELALEEIPQGQLKNYLLASASFFPGFRPRDIDGKTFIDGGYTDNMPTALAARLGAQELVCVDVDGVGIQRRNTTGLPTITIQSHWPMGPLMRFDPQQARRNIALGYWDTYRAFDRVLGTAYTLPSAQKPQLDRLCAAPYAAHLRRVLHTNPPLALTEGLALERFGATRDPELAPLELACELAGVDPTRSYTARQLVDAFLEQYPAQRAQRFAAFLEEEPPLALKEAALAAAQPSEFTAAMVWRAVSGAEL